MDGSRGSTQGCQDEPPASTGALIARAGAQPSSISACASISSMPAASFSGALLAIAALAVLGAAHVDAAEAGEAADAETCSAKHVCMDSKLVALLRKHELEAAIAPLVADDVRTLSTLEQLAACEESRKASFAPGWWWWPACDGVDTIVRKPNGLPKRTGEVLKKKLPELVAALRRGK